MNSVLTHWNALDPESAAHAILPCCGSQAWAEALTSERPFSDPETLASASDRIWLSLPEAAWQQAFDSHPCIGQHHAPQASATSINWSAQEQQAATPTQALAEANRCYEARFGRIFIVCATGKSTPEILAILESRMSNDTATELREAAGQQRQITQLRLRRWLESA